MLYLHRKSEILLTAFATKLACSLVCRFACVPGSFQLLIIEALGTDVSVAVRLVSGKSLLKAKHSTGHRRESNPGFCR